MPTREQLNKRAEKAMVESGKPVRKLTASEKKTPSQRRSENMRKKLNRGVVEPEVIPEDCRDCPEEPCGKTLKHCEKASLILRCRHCGQKIRFRVIHAVEWKECKECRRYHGNL
jgi:hypothetical protein